MHVPLAARETQVAKPTGFQSGSTNPIIIGVAVAIGLLFVAVAAYVYIAKRRPPNYSTTPKKSRSRWIPHFSGIGRFFRLKYSAPALNMTDTSYPPSTAETNRRSVTSVNIESEEGVNRNTSVRSIMTLPSYHPTPRPHERLIASEGERAGVDTVVEFPETADEEEARREEEMASLYAVRQARRQEIADRNERRRQRREATEQQDWARLEQLRLERQRERRERQNSSPASSETSLPAATRTVTANSSTLLAEHQARNASRERRISSVSYAELGLARHDGSRLRADSVESQRPLLENAASMGSDSQQTPPPPVPNRPPRFRDRFFHHRATSRESVMSSDSEDAHGAALTPQTSSAERTGSDIAMRTPSNDTTSEASPPMEEPPQYQEEANVEHGEAPPDYTSPVRDREEGAPRLPSLRVDSDLPSISITGSTPGATPVVGRGGEESTLTR